MPVSVSFRVEGRSLGLERTTGNVIIMENTQILKNKDSRDSKLIKSD